MAAEIVPVILSGGSGTRLWPLSVPAHPKQFHALVGTDTLFEQTCKRLAHVRDAGSPIIICNEKHLELVSGQFATTTSAPHHIVLEPAGRNTAPAVAVAALLAIKGASTDLSPLLLVMPADHVIADIEAFSRSVDCAVEAAKEGYLVTFGIVPTHPETGFGYLRAGRNRGSWFELDAFVEKPDLKFAEVYLESGDYLWNSGMFLLDAKLYLEELERHAPEMLRACIVSVEDALDSATSQAILNLPEKFKSCPADSIDYAVMEKTSRAAVVPLDAGWNDVGSWPALRNAQPQDHNGNVFRGDVVAMNSHNVLVHAAEKRVVIAGLENVVVVETDDTILVMADSESQNLKSIIKKSNRPAKRPK